MKELLYQEIKELIKQHEVLTEELQKLGNMIQEPLSKGVNPEVEEIAKKIYAQGGEEKLKTFVNSG